MPAPCPMLRTRTVTFRSMPIQIDDPLTEASPRQRTQRWLQVTRRFPEDQLAKALLADNAASLAGAEHDDEALVLAIATYEGLLATAERPEQRAALEHALSTLKGWTL